jgi:hypothetical protein
MLTNTTYFNLYCPEVKSSVLSLDYVKKTN